MKLFKIAALLGLLAVANGAPVGVDMNSTEPVPVSTELNITAEQDVTATDLATCRAYISRVWDENHRGLHRSTYAFWCDNCGVYSTPADTSDFDWAGVMLPVYEIWHQQNVACGSINQHVVRFDHKWNRWVFESTELYGVGTLVGKCMLHRFIPRWGRRACGLGGAVNGVIDGWGGTW